jgi:hypothetical protein
MQYPGNTFMPTDKISRKYIHAHTLNTQEIYSCPQMECPGMIFMLTDGMPRKDIHAHRWIAQE